MKKGIFIFIAVVIVAIICLAVYVSWALNHQGRGEEQEFIVQKGQGIQTVGKNLAAENLIPSATVFSLYAKMKGEAIQIGVYKLSSKMSTKEIFIVLAEGETVEDFITIPEGWRVTQIDEFLSQKEIIKAGELIKIASADEGYLFPDTYRLMPNTPAEKIRTEMIENFNKKTASSNISRETIILASIVEREAKFDEDRPKIAGVYLNRLAQNMKLEADPTIQYAKGSWDPITIADYHNVNSPYNTYLFTGLPPGPICNPGLKSIEAVLRPEQNGYFYFFHTTDGHAVFSATLEEHEAKLEQSK